MSQVTKMEWKEEFNTKFGKSTLNDDMGGHYIGSYLIEFIENLLTLSESRVRGEVIEELTNKLLAASPTDIDEESKNSIFKIAASLTKKEREE